MEDRTPERPEASPHLPQLTPETPPGAALLQLGGAGALLIPSSLFRPWDTPESLSPTSSNLAPESLSPSSSAPSDTTSPPSSLPSSPEAELQHSVYISPEGHCLYKLEPLEAGAGAGQGVAEGGEGKYDNLDFISGARPDSRHTRKRKRKERFQVSAASPVLVKKQRAAARGDFPPCGVCGEESTGVHYGAAVCEGCKGFFRRRVIYRDVAALVCGSGGTCSVTGKGRIHCKLCRYTRCVEAGMRPGAIKQEARTSTNLSFEEAVLRCHKETLQAVPAVYLGRQHTENIAACVAEAWPATADLGPPSSPAPGPASAAAFVRSLPGWAELSSADQQWSLATGQLQVMLARLLARWRPEVGAFLFPCGQFVYPRQLVAALPEVTVSHLTSLAHSVAARGLTQQEVALLCCLLAASPLASSRLYQRALAAVSSCSGGLHLLDLALQVAELAWTASPDQWTSIKLEAEQ